MSSARVLVVGGAVLDTKLSIRATPVLRTSNPGRSEWTAGGVGRNIAENLARLGTAVELVAAVGDDLAGESIIGRTAAAGVGCGHVLLSAHPTGTYAAVLDDRGDLLIGVADMTATDELAVADLESAEGFSTLLSGADLLVLDGNLAPEVAAWLLTEAARAGVRAIVEPVSVAKGRHFGTTLTPGRPAFAVTPNLDELASMLGLGIADEPAAIADAAAALHERGVTQVWVRRGMAGSLLSTRGTHGGRAVHLLSAPPAEVVDVTGAGDSMTAGFVHAVAVGKDVLSAAAFGAALASLTVESAETVRPDLSSVLVAERLAAHPPLIEEFPA